MPETDTTRLWKTLDRIDEITGELLSSELTPEVEIKLKSIRMLIIDIRSIENKPAAKSEYQEPFTEGYFSMARIPHLWLVDGDKVLVYSSEHDGSIGSDSLSDAFLNEKSLIEHCKTQNAKWPGMETRKVTVFEVTVRELKEIDLMD